MTGTFEFEVGDKRPMPDFNVFFRLQCFVIHFTVIVSGS